MAKAPASVAEQKPPTAATGYSVPDDLLDLTAEDAGKGVSFKQEDQLIPLIYVLQTNSPVVEERGSSYIEGAKAGHFWLRGAIHPIMSGVDGIAVIPCGMQRTYIEWLPQRQGFVMRHPEPPKDMETRVMKGDDGRERQLNVRKNGNIIQDTREFFILVDGFPYVLPCSGTKHTFARAWQSYYHQFRHPKTNGVMPSFSHKYLLTTVPQSNAQGKWFGLKFEDVGHVSLAEYKTAKAFNETVESGLSKPEAPMSAEGDPSAEPMSRNGNSPSGKEDIPF